jgi:hypothetical protein
MMIVSSSSAPRLSRSNTTTTQNSARRVTRETPSLMSVVEPVPPPPTLQGIRAPPSQSSMILGMSLPSAKNPSASAGNLSPSPSPSPRPASSPANSALGVPQQPTLKRKKTGDKRVSTASNVNGSLLVAPSNLNTLKTSATSPNLTSSTLKPAVKSSSTVGVPRPASILSVGSATASGVARRKSVRLAEDTKLSEAKYENSGGPANIPRAYSQPALNGSANPNPGILKESSGAVQTNHNVHDYSNAGTTSGAGVGEWTPRPVYDDDVSSDEGGDEYARIKHELNRSERGWKDAGFLDKGKGKARAY